MQKKFPEGDPLGSIARTRYLSSKEIRIMWLKFRQASRSNFGRPAVKAPSDEPIQAINQDSSDMPENRPLDSHARQQAICPHTDAVNDLDTTLDNVA
jgi:hypothetical protein